MEYLVILEKKIRSDWGAYVPDLPGCVATGSSRAEVEQLIKKAIQIHLAGMREDGLPIPEPTSSAFAVKVAEVGKKTQSRKASKRPKQRLASSAISM